jgi:hypothetical protein
MANILGQDLVDRSEYEDFRRYALKQLTDRSSQAEYFEAELKRLSNAVIGLSASAATLALAIILVVLK